jgi:hypothetical protein
MPHDNDALCEIRIPMQATLEAVVFVSEHARGDPIDKLAYKVPTLPTSQRALASKVVTTAFSIHLDLVLGCESLVSYPPCLPNPRRGTPTAVPWPSSWLANAVDEQMPGSDAIWKNR